MSGYIAYCCFLLRSILFETILSWKTTLPTKGAFIRDLVELANLTLEFIFQEPFHFSSADVWHSSAGYCMQH